MKISIDEVLIRLATVEDVPGIRKAIRSSIEGIASKDYGQDVINGWGLDTEKARLKQIETIRNGKELTWVAVRRNEIIGFSALAPETEELRAVYVAPEVARIGVGTKLLESVEARANALGLSKLKMHSSLTAVPFYERHGYSNNGELIHTLATGVKMKAVTMSKALG